MKDVEFPLFQTHDAYLPPGSNILLLGTGPSIIYNLRELVRYIREVDPIIISINGYLNGILSLKHQNLHEEFYRDDVDMNLIYNAMTEDVFESILPNVMFSNYLLQGEKFRPDGRKQKKPGSGSKYSPDLTEKLENNLFHCNVATHVPFMKNRGIYVQYAKNARVHRAGNVIRNYYYGSLEDYKYDRAKSFDLYPPLELEGRHRNLFSLNKSIKLRLNRLYDEHGVRFLPRHGGEYYLSWLYYNQIDTLAICGVFDKFKSRCSKLIRSWFWCRPGRVIPKKMISSQMAIIDLYRHEFHDRFVDLNLKEIK